MVRKHKAIVGGAFRAGYVAGMWGGQQKNPHGIFSLRKRLAWTRGHAVGTARLMVARSNYYSSLKARVM